jgi:hypothetical protein
MFRPESRLTRVVLQKRRSLLRSFGRVTRTFEHFKLVAQGKTLESELAVAVEEDFRWLRPGKHIATKLREGSMRSRLGIVIASAVGLCAVPALAAPNYSQFGQVIGIETGWSDDTMAVKLDVPTVNSPTPCKITTAGYALDPTDRGVKLHQSVLLSAFLTGRKVRVLVDGCVYDKPRIIGVGIGEPVY